jgi:hypothetical protein
MRLPPPHCSPTAIHPVCIFPPFRRRMSEGLPTGPDGIFLVNVTDCHGLSRIVPDRPGLFFQRTYEPHKTSRHSRRLQASHRHLSAPIGSDRHFILTSLPFDPIRVNSTQFDSIFKHPSEPPQILNSATGKPSNPQPATLQRSKLVKPGQTKKSGGPPRTSNAVQNPEPLSLI